MKKILALLLVLLLVPSCAFADSEYFKFADISLNGSSLNQIKSSLESATGVKFRIESGQVTTDLEPPITFMTIPIYNIYASSQPLGGSLLAVCLKPFEIDGYNNGAIQSFDNGIYEIIREKTAIRFGKSSRYFVHFFNGSFTDLSVIDNAKSYVFEEKELPYLLEDACSFMFRNAYDGAYIEAYRKNTSESYIITNATDQSLYGNVNVAFIVPTFTYYTIDVESLLDDKSYSQFPLFPMYNGSVQYTKDF